MSSLELLGIEPPPAIKGKAILNQELITKFKATAIQDADNKVYVQFPFNGKELNLNDNYPVALQRLFSLLKQLKNEKDLNAYNEIIQLQLKTGIIETVPETEIDQGPQYYIPHRVIVKMESLTTKLRIVLDASSHMKNEISLNDCVHPGPSILKSILGILLRSRITRYLVIADIEKAFHQVRVQRGHRNATMFLWLKDPTKPPTPDNIITYRFTRLPFGITASPFLLAITILLYMELNPHPINEKIKENLYVDNVLFTPMSQEEALKNYAHSKEAFQKMHMNLREFLCNSEQVMDQIPVDDKSKSTKVKVLGHSWDSIADTYTIKIAKPPEGRPTKRNIASFQASTYDPTGVLSPIVVPIKSLMAKINDTKTKWKDPIPDHLMPEFEQIRATFTEPTYTVPRQITPLQGYTKASLIIFSDASLEHYAMCAYIRFECSDNTVESKLIFSKSRIRPKNLKNLTIPRMELLGAVIAANAASTLTSELQIPFSSITLFCDNTAALHWIIHKKSEDKWVQARVKSITENLDSLSQKGYKASFRYVPTAQNPADIASRGATLAQLKTDPMWFNGAAFLQETEESWPPTLENSPEDPKEFHCFLLGLQIQDLPGQDIIVQHTVTDAATPTEQSVVPYERTNSLRKLVTIMQKVMRWVHRIVKKRNERHPNRQYFWRGIHMKEYAMATIMNNEVTKRVVAHQYILQDHYKDAEKQWEIQPPSSPDITKDTKGIYHYSNSYVNKKHKNMPKSLIYIVHKHPLAQLIALDYHISGLHQGPKDTVRDITNKYWIKHIVALSKTIRATCVTCRRRHGNPYHYPFATQLPSIRTQICRPFQNVGIDYFGPISYKNALGETSKLWVMLATCLLTRAVHLEVVPDNTTSSFLLAMRRFIGRRGTPRTIVSDNAPAFSLGYAMMNADIISMISSSLSLTSYLASKEIEVKQITPFAPWQGGAYERIVGIVKNLFYKSIGRLQLSYVEVETLMIECEGIINSRPITANSISISDTAAIRPIDFMLPQAELSIPNNLENRTSTKIGVTEKQTREYLKHLDNLRVQLWDEFYKEMYTGKQAPTYNDKAHCSVKPQLNHVVLVKTPNVPRYRWPLGRIIKLLPSTDGHIRSVRLKCKNAEIERAVNQLIPLELSTQDIDLYTDTTAV
ncbi:hypothetical protein B9Z55_008776 [Caenorhabditis nigoni]|nr:hypothetical protein B9Z55_008776 [Caenorhabditis nigoni]